MTEKERFQRAFAPLHASPDTMTEVMKMTERKMKRSALRRAATIGLAAALVLALGSVAYASDLGGIQRTVQLWLNGEMATPCAIRTRTAPSTRWAAVALPSKTTARNGR